MRTTIDLPDELFRKVKAIAARRGTTLKTLICAALERRVKFPLLDSREPGSLELTNAGIEDLLA